MKVKEESEEAGLKLNIQKAKVIASSTITSWQVDADKVEVVTDFIFLGFKITMEDDCRHEIKRHLLLGRKAMANLNSLLKTILLCLQGLYSQTYGFSNSHVWM